MMASSCGCVLGREAVPDSADQGVHIFRRNIVHDLLCRSSDIAAAGTKNIDLMQCPLVDLLRSTECQQALCIYSDVEDQVFAVLSLQELVIHDRLDRLEYVQADIDQMRDKRCDLTAGMHLNRNAGVMIHVEQFPQSGFQEIHENLLGEEGGNLCSKIISVMPTNAAHSIFFFAFAKFTTLGT